MSQNAKRSPAGGALLPALVCVSLLGCVTINVYFPEAEIKELSDAIESAIRERAEELPPAPVPQAREDAPASALWARVAPLLLRVTAAPAAAQPRTDRVPEPEVTSPAIRKIIESRARRLAELNRLKSRGVVGESREALVEIRDLDALELRERAAVQRLVKEENGDRETLFKEIAAVKNVDLSQLPRIRETYAVTLRQYARKGDWIEMPDGTWKRKE